jgi:pimeloyl-ACP methyl ester carboxylesterase
MLSTGGQARATGASLAARDGVRGGEILSVEIAGQVTAWEDLEKPRAPGAVELVWRVRTDAAGESLEVPVCAGRGRVLLDGTAVTPPDAGPLPVPLSAGEHVVSVRVTVSPYEKRVACGEPARLGASESITDGLLRMTFRSARAGGGHAVVLVPPRIEGSDDARRAMLVLPHPWNGSIWTYGAYAELLDEAKKRDLVLLFPSGLGNSLYTAAAEDEVLAAIASVETLLPIDPTRVSIAGASMGGAGATTIGFHHPDLFASITSFFGDAKYDLATYVRPILHDEAGAHLVNALDVADNARNVPVWLVHGEDDRVSPIAQSEILARALQARGFAVRFDRVPGMGHAGALFARFARELVARASEARAVAHPARITFRSVRPGDRCAYGVCLEREHGGDAFFDVAWASDGTLRVNRKENVRRITLEGGAPR